MAELELKIAGMSCGHCVNAVREGLEGLDGVDVQHVEIGSASVTYDPARSTPALIESAIEEAGYQLATVQLGRATPRSESGGRHDSA
jgi:copper chaperone